MSLNWLQYSSGIPRAATYIVCMHDAPSSALGVRLQSEPLERVEGAYERLGGGQAGGGGGGGVPTLFEGCSSSGSSSEGSVEVDDGRGGTGVEHRADYSSRCIVAKVERGPTLAFVDVRVALLPVLEGRRWAWRVERSHGGPCAGESKKDERDKHGGGWEEGGSRSRWGVSLRVEEEEEAQDTGSTRILHRYSYRNVAVMGA